MAISLGSNLSLHTRLVLDDRTLMDSILEMRDYPENFLPDIGYCFNKEDGKMYVFNRDNESTELTGKWREYGSGVGTDETVKLTSTSTDAKYLNELIDNSTIEVDVNNDCLVVKKIDGQTATVAEINFLTGVTANVQEQINNLGKSMTMYGVFGTKADLLASVDPVPVDGNTAIVVADEDNNNKQMTYIYIASTSKWTQVAESSIKIRDFTTNPINLSTEVTGKLAENKIDTAIARLADVLDKATYQGSAEGIVKKADTLTGLTFTIEELNKAITNSHKHNNKTLLDKIVSDGLGSNFLADNGEYISILSIGTSEPVYQSQIWIDNTDTSKPMLKIFDGTDWVKVTGGGSITIDDTLSDTSENPVQNKVVKQAIDNKADKTVATTSTDGLMSAADKTKLDGIEEGANKTVIDAALSSTSTNPVQNKVIKAELDKKANTVETATVTLSADSWIGNEQTVSASIVTSDCVVVISPVPDSQDEYSFCGIKCTSQSDGSLSFICSSTPSSNIDVNVVTI